MSFHDKWKKYILSESKDFAPPMGYFDTDVGPMSLYHEAGMNDHYIVLYHMMPDVGYNEFYIVAYIKLQKTLQPCIPNTFEVARVYVEPELHGKKFGKLIYRMAFAVAKKFGFGLTSDHTSGTLDQATVVWKKLDNDSEYTKNKTKAGNKEFDYNKSTPDPDDDCDDGGGFPAINHSLSKKDTSKDQALYEKLFAKHYENEQFLYKKELYELEGELISRGGNRFNKIFTKYANKR